MFFLHVFIILTPPPMSYILACTEISQKCIENYHSNTKYDLTTITTQIAKKYNLKTVPKLSDVIHVTPTEYQRIFTQKPVRTASGVAIVAVMCKPHRCPHIATTGNICVYCPGGPDSDFEYSTQSYTGYEPTSMRAIRHRYDPLQQSKMRLKQLKALGHSTDKVEFIVMGGTFLSLSENYRSDFIRGLYDSLTGNSSANLTDAIAVAEHSRSKCVAITIETRPDYCLSPHIDSMLRYGCTRVEIGVQSVYEDVARDTNRGHTVEAVKKTFGLTKDAGYKIVTHMMPNLPNVDYIRDIFQFTRVFGDTDFRPDGLKIYPTVVIKGTGLYELYKQNKYKSYSVNELVNLLATVLSSVPPWTRVYRVQRDIPMPLVTSGVEHANIREIALNRIKELKKRARDVRSREVGMKKIHENLDPVEVRLVRRDYVANGGWETFLSYEDLKNDILIGLLRLRKCSAATYRSELGGTKKNCNASNNINTETKNLLGENSNTELQNECFEACNISGKAKNVVYSAENVDTVAENACSNDFLPLKLKIDDERKFKEDHKFYTPRRIKNFMVENDYVSIIRELHVYGTAVAVDKHDDSKFQHQGYGSMLIAEAERIAKFEHKSKKIAIISGVGTRNYYKKFGYFLEGPYMVKELV